MTSAAPPEDLLERTDGTTETGAGIPREPLGPDDAAPGPAPARGRLRRFWFVPAGVALLGAAALVPSVGGSGPGAGEARVLVDGVAVVTDADGGTATVRDDRVDVGPGDEVEITEGRAVFEMAGDVRLEGLGASGDRDGTTVEMGTAPRLVTGRLLAVAPVPLEIETADATVSIEPSGSTDGAARLDRRLGLGVGTYRGRVGVETAGRRAEVPRYRRVEIAAAGELGPEGMPLRYEPYDAWDRRFLGEALVIDAQIAPLLASLGPAERESFLDPAALRDALPGLPSGGGLADRLAALDDGGGALVLAAIATAVDERSFTTAWDRAATFQGDGAPWGLAALDQGARSSEVLPTLRAALDTLDLQAPTTGDDDAEGSGTDGEADGDGADPTGAAAGATGPEGATATTPDDPTGGGTDPGSDGGGGVPGSPETPGGPGITVPTVPGVTPPTLPPTPTTPNLPEVVEGVGGTVGETVDGVTDGVDALVPGAGELVDDVLGGVGGVVGGAGAAIGGAGAAAGGVVGGIVNGLGQVVGGLGTGLGTGLGGSGGG